MNSRERIIHYLSKSNGHKLCNGEFIPALGIGTWDAHGESSYDAIKMAIDHGVRLIDTAYIYQNEHEIGQAIQEKIDEGAIKREEIFVITKLWNTHHRPDLVEGALMESLKNLRMEYVDLYLMHNPYAFQENDELYPRDENNEIISSGIDFIDTWHEMEKLVTAGLVKSIGVSNFNEIQLLRLLKLCDQQPAAIEFECHPFLTQFELSQFCKDNNIFVIAFGPLGSPERPIQFTGEPKLLHNQTIGSIAAKYNKSPAQILIRYQIQRGHTPIPKSETLEFIRQNVDVFNFEISAEDISRLNSLNIHRRFVNALCCIKLPEYPFHDDIRYGDQIVELMRC